MAIPDNLPRSPTGRVPQWVIDEASGRAADARPWRADETTPAPARPRRRWLVVIAVVVVVAVVTFTLGGPMRPWGTARPSAAAVALADEATMTDTGKNLFYSNNPQVLDAADFPGHCPQGAAGCYSAAARSIVILQPTDEHLHSQAVTIAAHEMLHAAYASLGQADRQDVDRLLASTVAALDPDDPVLVQIDGSVTLDGDEQSRATEEFAYVGTEVAWVAPRLDEVYARFFDDRQTLVHTYTSGTAPW